LQIEQAKSIAEKYLNLLKPFCLRIEIKGSICREKPEPNDIELVCIRDTRKGFDFVATVNQIPILLGSPAGKYVKLMLPEGIKLDLFMCTKENWGLISAIRTGSDQYSHEVLGKGWVRAGYKSVEGMLYKNGFAIPVYEERDLFNLIGVKYIEPIYREM